jgi:hypothetical protein
MKDEDEQDTSFYGRNMGYRPQEKKGAKNSQISSVSR